MVTRAIVRFGIYDTTAKEEAVYASDNAAIFSDAIALEQEAYQVAPYATLALNQWILDGNQIQPPEVLSDGTWGLISSTLSDVNGLFFTPMKIVASFTNPHTSAGITLYALDWPAEVIITWRDDIDAILETVTFNPNSASYFAEKYVAGYYKVEVEFTKTTRPYSYASLQGIQYGLEYIFAPDEIISANTVAEISPISECIMSGEFNMLALPAGGSFNIYGANGIFAALQSGQQLAVSARVDEVEESLGIYYLDDWSAVSGVKINFKYIDIIGMLGKQDCLGGLYSGVLLSTLLTDVFLGTAVTFVIDEQLSATIVTGWIPVTDYRTALQLICFAAGATALVLADGRIYITPLTEDITSSFDASRIFINPRVEKRPEITDVEIMSHTFFEDTGAEETTLLQQTYLIGSYRIYFSEPVYALSCTGATIIESDVNYAVLEVAAAGEVILVGKIYAVTNQMFRTFSQTPLAGGARTYALVDKCTTVATTVGQYLSQYVYDYYAHARKVTFSAVRTNERVGDIARVYISPVIIVVGPITKMVLNLIGMITEYTVIGDVYDLTAIDELQKVNLLITNERPVV